MENDLKVDEKALEKQIEKHRQTCVTSEILSFEESKIIQIFKKIKNKLTESKSGLFIHPEKYKFLSEEYKNLFNYESSFPLKDKKQFAVIYDCLNFICFNDKQKENAKNNDYYINIVNNLFSLLTEKGTVLILIDINYVENFFQNFTSALGDNNKTKFFINFYFLDTHSFLFLATIQKMSTSEQPIKVDNIKILITDFTSNINQKLIGSQTVGEFKDFLKVPLIQMQTYHLQRELNYARLKIIHPGEYFQMLLKSSPFNSAISFIATIYDNSTNTDGKNKNAIAIANEYEITQELLYSKSFSYDQMCQQLNIGRIIIIESSILNPTTISDLYIELKNEVQLMKPEGNNQEVIIKAWEDKNPKILLYDEKGYLIRDNEDKQFIMRQLFYNDKKNCQNMIQAKIRVKLVSKSKINNPKGGVYYPVETQTKLKNKGVIECVDEFNILGFYEKCMLCSSFHLDLNVLQNNTIKIMDIGAGTGLMSFYFYKLFRGSCEIDNIEKNKTIYELGLKYFGFRNYDTYKNRVNWFFEDVRECIDKMIHVNKIEEKKIEKKYENKKAYYDLILNEINDVEDKESIIPSTIFFSDKFITNIKELLKPSGVYTVNICSKNCRSLYENYLKLEKFFPTIFSIPSENGLASIFFCFKEKFDVEHFNTKFQNNKAIMEKNAIVEYSLLKIIVNEVISRITDMEEQKKKFADRAKVSS